MSQEQQPIRFAYWVPNVSGGLVVSKIEQRTSWDIDYNRKLAQLAERNGFDYALRRSASPPATAPSTSTSRWPSATPCWRPPRSSR